MTISKMSYIPGGHVFLCPSESATVRMHFMFFLTFYQQLYEKYLFQNRMTRTNSKICSYYANT
jgi:hypothetical protein